MPTQTLPGPSGAEAARRAAGALLVTEAGGMVGNLLGDDGYLESGNVVAANPKIFAQLVPLFAPHLTPPLRL